MRRVLILFAHPAFHKSRVNRAMAGAARHIQGITFHDLYETYPDLIIDVDREQKLLMEHDVFLFQTPLYWYSTPAIVKEWQDLVLEYGFAYGPGGDRLRGKIWVHSFTAGGPQEAYQNGGYNRFTMREFIVPLEQTAHLCGIRFLEPFVVHHTLRMSTEVEIPKVAATYGAFIRHLQTGDLMADRPFSLKL